MRLVFPKTPAVKLSAIAFVVIMLLSALNLGDHAFASPADPIKIGFLVKQADEPWFQDEWRYAEQAAKEKGFTLIKINIPDNEKTLAAIELLASQKAQGLIICAPDVKLGSSIARLAKKHNLKLMSVDDQLIDDLGKPIHSIPHMGISGSAIGRQIGVTLIAEMNARGWKYENVGAIRISYDKLPTARDRTMGAVIALKAAGFPAANIFDAPQNKLDTESAFDAANQVLSKQKSFKHWVIFGMNDETVLGGVRAAEGRNFHTESVIAIGIGGSTTAINEFSKPIKATLISSVSGRPSIPNASGFFATVLISPKRHGYETSINMYNWIAANIHPPMLTLTSGTLMTRKNLASLRDEFDLD